ncbi:MAG: hypothetical protein HYX71_05865 [Opitutae bacterium]|nr:hypothetical protein [Opitutae bacterium]
MKNHARHWLVGLMLLSKLAPAAETPPANEKPSDNDLRVRGIFNSALPRTEKKNSLRLIVHPRLGDLTKRDNLRTVLGFRYGLTTRWEATAEVDAYFSHGLKAKGFFAESGFSTFRLGTKYRLGEGFTPGWDTAVGLDFAKPIGSPPIDVTDGLRHIAPFITTSRPLAGAPGWRVFGGAGWDDVTKVSARGKLEKNELGDDSVNVSSGLLWDRGTAIYALEAAYATTRFTADVNRNVYALRPSVVWVLPAKYTFNSKGKWLLGVGLRFSRGPDGNDLGLNVKLRVNFDFKRLLGRKNEPASGP